MDTDKSKYFILENGLQVFLEARHNIPLINIVFGINIGSKDENKEISGIVHLLEHLILLGSTNKLDSKKIINEMRGKGLSLNAHTDRDFMTVEISLPGEFTDFGLELVKEKLFNLRFSREELEKEKKVIIEEINQIQDDPFRSGKFSVLQKLFRDHTYEKPVYGEKKIIRGTTVEQLKTVYEKYFIPSNCSISVVGDFDIPELTGKIKKTFSPLKKKNKPQSNFKIISALDKKIEHEDRMDITEGYVLLGFCAPHLSHDDHMAVKVLSHILGRGVTPLLGTFLGKRKKLVEGISIQYIAQKYGGAIIIYLRVDQKNMMVAKRETINFLKKTGKFKYSKNDFLLRHHKYIFDYLETAKNHLLINRELSHESSMSLAVSYVREMLSGSNPISGDLEESLGKIESNDIKRVASKYLSGKRYVTVFIFPKDKK